MKWTENKQLATLIVSEDVHYTYTTYERLCYHLVHQHGYDGWMVEGRTQMELEAMHNRKEHEQ